MLFSSRRKSLVFITIFSFLMILFILPTNGYSKWVSNPPPDEGISTTTLILIGVGTAVVMYFLLSASSSSEKPDDNTEENKGVETDSLKSSLNNNLFKYAEFIDENNNLALTESALSVLPVLELENKSNMNTALSKTSNNLKVKVGFSIKF